MSGHTPGPNRLPCGCTFAIGRVEMCPTHEAAPDLLEALKTVAFVLSGPLLLCRRCKEPVDVHSALRCEVAAAIAKAEIGPESDMGEDDETAPAQIPQPIGRCGRCGTPKYIEAGYCGVCNP